MRHDIYCQFVNPKIWHLPGEHEVGGSIPGCVVSKNFERCYLLRVKPFSHCKALCKDSNAAPDTFIKLLRGAILLQGASEGI